MDIHNLLSWESQESCSNVLRKRKAMETSTSGKPLKILDIFEFRHRFFIGIKATEVNIDYFAPAK